MSLDPKEFAQRLIEEARKEAEKILEEARKKAEEILSHAREQAERIKHAKEIEARARVRQMVAKMVGEEKRKARIEVSMKRRELVDKAIARGVELASEKLNEEILNRRLEEALKLEAKRTKLVGDKRLANKAKELGLEFEEKPIKGFLLIAPDRTVEETIDSRAERRQKFLEAIAAEEVLGRRVRL